MSDKVKAQSNWHSKVSSGKKKYNKKLNEKNWQLEVSPDEKMKKYIKKNWQLEVSPDEKQRELAVRGKPK